MSHDRSRDRSPRGRSRSRSPYRPRISTDTNSDDPKDLLSRIFVGSLPTDRISRREIEDVFGKYGSIRAISLLRGFGFVQYEKEEHARRALQHEKGANRFGARLDVRCAAEGRLKGYKPPPPLSPPREQLERDRRSRSSSAYRDERSRSSSAYRDEFPNRREHPIAKQKSDLDNIVDCEVICLSNRRPLRAYADYLVDKLKEAKVVGRVHILPLNDNLARVMDECIRKRILYAVVLNDDNEIHRSITLSILHGTPQEHRNMPLDQALVLVEQNFRAYTEELTKRVSGPPAQTVGYGPNEFTPPNQHVTYLLNLLADSRFLTLEELNQVLDYLTERRNRLMEAQGMVPPPKAKHDADLASEQKALQSKIMNILSGGDTPSTPPQDNFPERAPLMESSSIDASINFDNPNVKQALDNLISDGSLLKNISAVSAPEPKRSMPYAGEQYASQPRYDDQQRYGGY